MKQIFEEIGTRMSEGWAVQKHLGEDIKNDTQNKMRGGRSMDRTTESWVLEELQEEGALQGGVGVFPQTTGVRLGYLPFRILLTMGMYLYRKSPNVISRSVCDVRSGGRLW